MSRFSEVEVSGRIVLRCGTCGEQLVLLEREDDRYSEGRTAFACGRGARLTLADRVGERDLAIAELLRGPRATDKLAAPRVSALGTEASARGFPTTSKNVRGTETAAPRRPVV